MEWVIASIVVLIMPLGMIFWWIPHCDAIGVRKSERSHRERAPMTPIRRRFRRRSKNFARVSHDSGKRCSIRRTDASPETCVGLQMVRGAAWIRLPGRGLFIISRGAGIDYPPSVPSAILDQLVIAETSRFDLVERILGDL